MSEADAHMPDLSVLEQVSELARAGEPFALATVVWLCWTVLMETGGLAVCGPGGCGCVPWPKPKVESASSANPILFIIPLPGKGPSVPSNAHCGRK